VPGPSNLYGVANPVAVPIILSTATLIACNPGVETTVLSSAPLVAPSAGFFYPLIFLAFLIQFGATLPTTLSFNARIGAGADFDQMGLNMSAATALGNIMYYFPLVGIPSNVAWAGSGSVLNLTINAAAQLVNFIGSGSRAIVALYRAPDQ
jgi:hypothetical protein